MQRQQSKEAMKKVVWQEGKENLRKVKHKHCLPRNKFLYCLPNEQGGMRGLIGEYGKHRRVKFANWMFLYARPRR